MITCRHDDVDIRRLGGHRDSSGPMPVIAKPTNNMSRYSRSDGEQQTSKRTVARDHFDEVYALDCLDTIPPTRASRARSRADPVCHPTAGEFHRRSVDRFLRARFCTAAAGAQIRRRNGKAAAKQSIASNAPAYSIAAATGVEAAYRVSHRR